MKRINVGKFVLDVLILLSGVTMLFCLFFIFKDKKKVVENNEPLKEFVIIPEKLEDVKLETKTSNVNIAYSESSLDEYRHKYKNDELVGILSIENTKINTVLMQTNNNSYYVRRLPNKKKHITGSVFVDYRTKLNQDKDVIIYGHNANNYDIPFRYLRNYLKKDFYLNNRYIDIITDDAKWRYEIFSVYTTKKDDEEHLLVNFKDDNKRLEHLNVLKQKSIYGTNISLNANDSIVILQTCLLKDDALIVICAKKL